MASKTALETYKSSVFRNGDWNVADPHLVKHSVTCNDFHIKPFSTEAESQDRKRVEEEEGTTQNEREELPVDPKGNHVAHRAVLN